MSLPFDPRMFFQRRFAAGTVIFREGDPGDNCYILKEGTVRILKGPEGNQRTLGTIGSGCLFGEMALIDDQPRMASAHAITPVVCMVITRDQFRERVDHCDPFVRALLRILVQCARLPLGG